MSSCVCGMDGVAYRRLRHGHSSQGGHGGLHGSGGGPERRAGSGCAAHARPAASAAAQAASVVSACLFATGYSHRPSSSTARTSHAPSGHPSASAAVAATTPTAWIRPASTNVLPVNRTTPGQGSSIRRTRKWRSCMKIACRCAGWRALVWVKPPMLVGGKRFVEEISTAFEL